MVNITEGCVQPGCDNNKNIKLGSSKLPNLSSLWK